MLCFAEITEFTKELQGEMKKVVLIDELVDNGTYPLGKFTGEIIAIVHRKNDIEEKCVVVPEEMTFSKEEIREEDPCSGTIFRL